MSRRSLLGGAGAIGLGAALSACGTGSGTPTGDERPVAAKDTSATDKVVNWANWPLYLDYDEDETREYPTLEKFQEVSGIRATYDEAIEDNDSYYGKIQGQLQFGQDIGKDVIVFTDWMAGRVIRQGYTQKLNKANIPNAKNLIRRLQNVDFDPGRAHSLTWQSGYAGIAWNKAAVKRAFPNGLSKVSDLWHPSLRGRVEVLTEMRDTMGLILLEQGKKISEPFTTAEFEAAIEVLEQQVTSGQIRKAAGNSYKEDLISGDALAVIGWSGDITQINFENGNKWEFAIPEAGGTLWSDNLLVPIGSPHKTNAEKLMDFYYDPKIAAEVAAYVNYICPVQGAQAEMQKIDRELADNRFIFPTEEDLENVSVFRALSAEEERTYTGLFQAVLGV